MYSDEEEKTTPDNDIAVTNNELYIAHNEIIGITLPDGRNIIINVHSKE